MTNELVTRYPLLLGNYGFTCVLWVIDLRSYDVVLGMDWLSKHKVQIDCANHLVDINNAQGAKVTCIGGLASSAKSLHLILMNSIPVVNKEEYHSLNGVAIEEKLKKIPLANQFPEVFPVELPGLPPKRDTKFSIYLQPKTEPISVPPY